MNRLEFYDYIFRNKNMTKLAIKNEQISLSYAELQEEIYRCVKILKRYNIKKGSKIGVMIKDHAIFLIVLMAGILVDATIVPIYINIGQEKIIHIIDELNINILISEKKNKSNDEKKINCMQKELFIYMEAEYQDDIDDDIVLIMLTSGTTSKSKGVMLSTINISSNVQSICNYLKLVEKDIILIVKNTNHVSTIVAEMLVSLYAGVTMVFCENVIHMNYLNRLIDKYMVSVFFAVPFLLRKMVEQEEASKGTLRIVNFYGSAISITDIKCLLQKYTKVNFIYSYGQTEASPRVTYIEREEMAKYWGSSGKTIEGISLNIQDEHGNILKPYAEGEIIVSGPNVMRGYYNNEVMTQKVIVDGQLHTGDLGYINEEGYLYVTGRKDNMIIISGKNIHPEEIEEIISEYEGVLEVLVEKKEYGGISGLVCYVVKRKESIIESKDILRFVRARVEDYKTPREIIFVTELEKTTSGKVKRKQSINKNSLEI